MTGAIDLLGAPGNLDYRVHEARKHLKRLRAVFALAEGSADARELQRAVRATRRAARALAPLRGQAALVEALEALRADERAGIDDATFERIRERLPVPGASPAAWEVHAELTAARKLLERAREALQRIDFHGSGWQTLEPGFRHTYRRARRNYERAAQQPAAELLHTFRIPAKRHFYQVQLFEPLWPELLQAHRKELSRLGDLLGEHHDLSLLGPELARRGVDAADLAALRPLLDRRSRALTDQALALGGLLFAERPRAIARRFGAYFEAARRRSVSTSPRADVRRFRSSG